MEIIVLLSFYKKKKKKRKKEKNKKKKIKSVLMCMFRLNELLNLWYMLGKFEIPVITTSLVCPCLVEVLGY